MGKMSMAGRRTESLSDPGLTSVPVHRIPWRRDNDQLALVFSCTSHFDATQQDLVTARNSNDCRRQLADNGEERSVVLCIIYSLYITEHEHYKSLNGHPHVVESASDEDPEKIGVFLRVDRVCCEQLATVELCCILERHLLSYGTCQSSGGQHDGAVNQVGAMYTL